MHNDIEHLTQELHALTEQMVTMHGRLVKVTRELERLANCPVCEPQPVADPQPETDPQPVAKPVVEPVVELALDIETQPEPEPVIAPEPKPVPQPAGAIRLSLNDRYLFQRELFDNNAARLNEALTRLNTLTDVNAINSYLFDDLGLDPDYPVVSDFVDIIVSRLNSKR